MSKEIPLVSPNKTLLSSGGLTKKPKATGTHPTDYRQVVKEREGSPEKSRLLFLRFKIK